jgi:hypothetical protein
MQLSVVPGTGVSVAFRYNTPTIYMLLIHVLQLLDLSLELE